jgi:hypothetical protein
MLFPFIMTFHLQQSPAGAMKTDPHREQEKFQGDCMAHSISDALNMSSLNFSLVKAFQKAWSRETCWEGNAAEYAGQNPSLGQCLVSVLAAWADGGFTDIIQPVLVQADIHPPRAPAWHFNLHRSRLSLYEYDIDPTYQQFPRGSRFETMYRLGATHALYFKMIYESFFEPAARESLERRLSLFIQRLETEGGYTLKKSPEEILTRLDHAFSHVLDQAREQGLSLPASHAAPRSPPMPG